MLAVVLLVIGLGLSWGLGSLMVRSHSTDVTKARPPARDFRLAAADGMSVASTYWPGARVDSPAVLLLHGVGASRNATAPNAAWLAARGFAVLTIDFRGHGQSGAAWRSFGLEEARDARAAFDWLKRQQRGSRVAVVGISLGGAASLLGEDGPLPADALVLQAVYPDIRSAIRNRISRLVTSGPAIVLEPLLSFQSRLRFGVWPSRLSPAVALRRYRGPVLIVAGEKDRHTPPSEARQMLAAAPAPKALWIAPDADHAEVSDLRTDAYRVRLMSFLKQTIGDPRS